MSIYPTSFAQLMLHLADINEHWADLAEGYERATFPRGKVILPTADYLYFVHSGMVRTSFTTPDGLEWIFIYQKDGCIFNELGVLGQHSKVFYTCQTDIVVSLIPSAVLQSLAFSRDYPHLLLNLIETLALKESICFSYMTDLARLSARGRVSQALLALAREHGEARVFVPDITQAEIASMMGLHPTSVARVVRALRSEGIIGAFTKKRLEIVSYDRLRELEYESDIPE